MGCVFCCLNVQTDVVNVIFGFKWPRFIRVLCGFEKFQVLGSGVVDPVGGLLI